MLCCILYALYDIWQSTHKALRLVEYDKGIAGDSVRIASAAQILLNSNTEVHPKYTAVPGCALGEGCPAAWALHGQRGLDHALHVCSAVYCLANWMLAVETGGIPTLCL